MTQELCSWASVKTLTSSIAYSGIPFRDEGNSETDESIVKRPASAGKTKILCIDTEPEVTLGLKEVGYAVSEVSMGFRTGKRVFQHPAPNEVDLMVCDLRRPACFDSREWGAIGKNNQFFCKILPQEMVGNQFRVHNGRRIPLYKLIYESQLGKQIPGTFGAKDVNSAIVRGGIPFLLFLNQEWLSKIDIFPNWFDTRWTFLPTAATQVEIGPPLSTLLPEIQTGARLKLAIQHRIENGPLFSQMPPPFVTSVKALVTNNVGHTFGQFVRMGNGSVWLLPSTHRNIEIIQLVASRLERLQRLTLQPEETPSTREIARGTSLNLGLAPETARRKTVTEPTIKVFISHSSADVTLAQALIYLLKDAIPELRPEAIRCTSVPGYKLQGGVQTDDQLRREMGLAPVFIGLLTKESLTSTYVLFELGARWGARLKFTPLVAAGLRMSDLKPPLAGLHAQSCDSDTDLQQMLVEISCWLNLKMAGAHVYDAHLKRLVDLSVSEGKRRLKPILPSP